MKKCEALQGFIGKSPAILFGSALIVLALWPVAGRITGFLDLAAPYLVLVLKGWAINDHKHCVMANTRLSLILLMILVQVGLTRVSGYDMYAFHPVVMFAGLLVVIVASTFTNAFEHYWLWLIVALSLATPYGHQSSSLSDGS